MLRYVTKLTFTPGIHGPVAIGPGIESISTKSVYFKLYNFNFMQLSDIL